MMDMRWHIGNVIERVRTEKGMNQAELAAKAGVRPNTLGDLENRRKNTRLETLERVAGALGTTVGDLYCELDETVRQRHPKSADGAASMCPANNPGHLPYHQGLEKILHEVPNGEEVLRIATPALKAIVDAALGSPPEKKQPAGGGQELILDSGKRIRRR